MASILSRPQWVNWISDLVPGHKTRHVDTCLYHFDGTKLTLAALFRFWLRMTHVKSTWMVLITEDEICNLLYDRCLYPKGTWCDDHQLDPCERIPLGTGKSGLWCQRKLMHWGYLQKGHISASCMVQDPPDQEKNMLHVTIIQYHRGVQVWIVVYCQKYSYLYSNEMSPSLQHNCAAFGRISHHQHT